MLGLGSRQVLGAIVLLTLVQTPSLGADEAVVRIGDWTMTAPEIKAEFGFSQPALLNQVRRSDNAARLLAVEWYSNALIAKAAVDEKLLDQQPGLKAAADTLRNKMIAGRVLPRYVSERYKPDDRELQQFVELNEQICQAPTRYRVARIGVVVGKKASEPEQQGAKARIDDVQKRLAAGEAFGKVADEKSDLPSKIGGGEVGWLTADEVGRTEGNEKLTALKKDQVSEVIPTSDGFVIFKLLDREEARKLSFEECRATAERTMNERYRAQIARDWIEELAKKYDSTMNMDAFVAAVRSVEIPKDWLERQAAKGGSGDPSEP